MSGTNDTEVDGVIAGVTDGVAAEIDRAHPRAGTALSTVDHPTRDHDRPRDPAVARKPRVPEPAANGHAAHGHAAHGRAAHAAGPGSGDDDPGEPRRIRPGHHVGRYIVERRLGAGGMGVVYLARDPDLARPVAIKVVRPDLHAGRSRLLREGQAVAKLVHPNVVTVFDVGTLGDDLFIAMEYVPGTTLGDWLEAKARPWREVLDRFRDAGRGLAAAHRAGLVHRDVKPDNILLGDDGRVVVSDFGLSRLDDGGAAAAADAVAPLVTRTAGMIGTPAYMSPEQFRSGPVDARSDQFSFCVALWQGFFGHRPFDTHAGSTSSIDDVARSVLAGVIHGPPSNHHVPSHIVRALRRGLSNDPADRFPSMEALLAVLRPVDHRRVVVGAAGTTLGLGVLAVVMLRPGSAPGSGAAVPPSSCDAAADRIATVWTAAARAAYAAGPGDPADINEDLAWFDEHARRWSTTSLAACEDRGRGAPVGANACLDDSLAALGRALDRDPRALWPELPDPRACLVTAPPRTSRELRLELGNIDPYGAIAPDGSSIAFVAASDHLQALMRADGESLRSELLTGVERVFHWSADGRRLIAAVDDAAVDIDVASGIRTVLPWRGEIRAVSPDGRIAARIVDDALHFVDADGRDRARLPALTGDDAETEAVAIEPGGNRAAVIEEGDHDWSLVIVDLIAGTHLRRTLRLHGNAGATVSMAWAGPGRLVVSGSNRNDDAEGLWLIELTAAGTVAGPPAVLIAPRPNVVVDLLDVEGDRALVVLVDVPSHVLRARDGTTSPLPGLHTSRIGAVDAVRERLLLIADDRLRVVGVDGALIAEHPRGKGRPVLYDGELWLARADGHDVVLSSPDARQPREIRLAGQLTSELDRIRCNPGATTHCFVSWWVDDEIRHAFTAGTRTLGPAIDIPVRERDLDLTADGQGALVIIPGQIATYDVADGSLKVLHREPTCRIRNAVWTPAATSIVFDVDCDGRRELRIKPATPRGKVRTLASSSAYITGYEALGEDDIVYSTRDYESRLVLIEGLPLTAPADKK